MPVQAYLFYHKTRGETISNFIQVSHPHGIAHSSQRPVKKACKSMCIAAFTGLCLIV